jgi:hypothetical protein
MQQRSWRRACELTFRTTGVNELPRVRARLAKARRTDTDML